MIFRVLVVFFRVSWISCWVFGFMVVLCSCNGFILLRFLKWVICGLLCFFFVVRCLRMLLCLVLLRVQQMFLLRLMWYSGGIVMQMWLVFISGWKWWMNSVQSSVVMCSLLELVFVRIQILLQCSWVRLLVFGLMLMVIVMLWIFWLVSILLLFIFQVFRIFLCSGMIVWNFLFCVCFVELLVELFLIRNSFVCIGFCLVQLVSLLGSVGFWVIFLCLIFLFVLR